MEYVLSLAILILALAMVLGKPLQITVTHQVSTPPQVIPPMPEEDPDDGVRQEISKAMQEMMGVFADDDR